MNPSVSLSASSNLALNLAPVGRWTLRDKAAQRRLALRCRGHFALAFTHKVEKLLQNQLYEIFIM